MKNKFFKGIILEGGDNKMTQRLAIIIMTFLTSTLAYSAVWQTQNEWSQDWEHQYQNWVQTNWKFDVFSNPNSKYYGVKTDCADAVYAIRAIFAFENALPFAIQDPTRYTRVPITNEMGRWDRKASELDRVKSFINYLSGIVSTHTMPQNTVPVAINRESLVAGITYVKPKKHSYIITGWTKVGIPVRMHSTTPYAVRELAKFTAFPQYVPVDFVKFSDGYRRFKRPNELYKPISTLEGYSIEQYSVSENYDADKNKFDEYVKNKTHLEKEAVAQQTNRMLNNLCEAMYHRAESIRQGHDFYLKIQEEGRSCMNANEFDQYSTFSRDKRLVDQFAAFKHFVKMADNFSGTRFRNKNLSLDIVSGEAFTRYVAKEQVTNFCHIMYDSTHGERVYENSLNLKALANRIDEGLLEQNPNTTEDRRWGHYYGEFQTSCPTFEEIH